MLRTGKGYLHRSLLNHFPLVSFIPKLAHIDNVDRPNLWVVEDTLGYKNLTSKTFVSDATRLWNKAPLGIRQAKSIGIVKKEIKLFCKNLPI